MDVRRKMKQRSLYERPSQWQRGRRRQRAADTTEIGLENQDKWEKVRDTRASGGERITDYVFERAYRATLVN